MTEKEIIAIAQKAGLTIYRGNQDRVLWEGDIIEILIKFNELMNQNKTFINGFMPENVKVSKIIVRGLK
jgi:hypothetical protein